MNGINDPPRDREARRYWKIYHFAEHYGIGPTRKMAILAEADRYDAQRKYTRRLRIVATVVILGYAGILLYQYFYGIQ
jgi:hypothetical protein